MFVVRATRRFSNKFPLFPLAPPTAPYNLASFGQQRVITDLPPLRSWGQKSKKKRKLNSVSPSTPRLRDEVKRIQDGMIHRTLSRGKGLVKRQPANWAWNIKRAPTSHAQSGGKLGSVSRLRPTNERASCNDGDVTWKRGGSRERLCTSVSRPTSSAIQVPPTVIAMFSLSGYAMLKADRMSPHLLLSRSKTRVGRRRVGRRHPSVCVGTTRWSMT